MGLPIDVVLFILLWLLSVWQTLVHQALSVSNSFSLMVILEHFRYFHFLTLSSSLSATDVCRECSILYSYLYLYCIPHASNEHSGLRSWAIWDKWKDIHHNSTRQTQPLTYICVTQVWKNGGSTMMSWCNWYSGYELIDELVWLSLNWWTVLWVIEVYMIRNQQVFKVPQDAFLV